GIRLAGKFFDPFGNLGVQWGDAHLVRIDVQIGQRVVFDELSHSGELFVQHNASRTQIGGRLERDRDWRRAGGTQRLPVGRRQQVRLKGFVLVTAFYPDIAGAQAITQLREGTQLIIVAIDTLRGDHMRLPTRLDKTERGVLWNFPAPQVMQETDRLDDRLTG